MTIEPYTFRLGGYESTASGDGGFTGTSDGYFFHFDMLSLGYMVAESDGWRWQPIT